MNPGTEGTGTSNPHGNFEVQTDQKPNRFNTLHTQHKQTTPKHITNCNCSSVQSSSVHKFDSKATEHKLDKLHEGIGAE